MFDSSIDDLVQRLLTAVPKQLHSFEQDMREQFREVLQLAFDKLDLVTRQEFDVQCNVLSRTREKVEQLQAQIDELMLASCKTSE